jgi:hypothetical protein
MLISEARRLGDVRNLVIVSPFGNTLPGWQKHLPSGQRTDCDAPDASRYEKIDENGLTAEHRKFSDWPARRMGSSMKSQ